MVIVLSNHLQSDSNHLTAIRHYILSSQLDKASSLCIENSLFLGDRLDLNYFLAFIASKKKETNNIIYYCERALILAESGKISEADYAYINDIGNLFFGLGRYVQAEKCFLITLRLKPGNYIATYNLAQALIKVKDYQNAFTWLKKAEEINPCFDVIFNIGALLCDIKNFEMAEEYLKRAMKMNPDDWGVYHNLSTIAQRKGEKENIIKYCKKALELNPRSSISYAALGEVESYVSDPDNNAWMEKEVKEMLRQGGFDNKATADFYYTLGNIYRVRGNYDEAFANYTEANKVKYAVITFNINKLRSAKERFPAAYGKDIVVEKQAFGNKSTLPGFILGMPRSGTTLVEQILLQHSKVGSLGETKNIWQTIINKEYKDVTENGVKMRMFFPEVIKYFTQQEVQDIAATCLNNIQTVGDGYARIFDKMPENSFNVGFIKILFPNAMIINCKRHPLDIIVSMFENNFLESDLPAGIELITEYYKIYSSIMQHWYSVFPGQIYDNYYEELVYNQEEKSRKLIAACSLEWEEDCLRFYNSKRLVTTASKLQVKQPIYKKSVFRWMNYDRHLGFAKEMLCDEIVAYEREIASRVPELDLCLG
ncbi:MAG: sulfotransferase [Rickettsiaceae bacterium]|jgi:tetratricopeptide (TPR) repeat protein|nr:sulfotransferase [Rickettsiaceae bacterium]